MPAALARVFEVLGDVERAVPEETAGLVSGSISVDPDSLANITGRLSPMELASLGMTCRALRVATATIYPGIKLRLYPHQRASVAFLLSCEANPDQRGGVLADEPGTGKTVTMLALICKTAGRRTAPAPDVAQSRRDAAAEEWLHLGPSFKRELVYRVLKSVQKSCPDGYGTFAASGAQAAAELPHYRTLVPNPPDPPDFNALRHDRAIARLLSRAAFDAAALAVPRAGIAYWSSAEAAAAHPGGPEAAAHLASLAMRLEASVEAALDTHRPNLHAPPPPLRSGATLLVVPKPLLQHWREQIAWHVDEAALEGGVLLDPHALLAGGASGHSASATAAGRAKTLRELWSAEELARCAVLVTSSERLSLEQRHATATGQPSVLCEVHWARLVCDEGHHLGGGALTNAKILLMDLPAERRWILSGTPAKETSDAEGCATLGGLLHFLRDPRRHTVWPPLSRRLLKASAALAAATTVAAGNCSTSSGPAAAAAAAAAASSAASEAEVEMRASVEAVAGYLEPLMVRQLTAKI